ncbi:MAG: hypothetical protein LAT78_13535 [Roseinatronobacter sp.]|jgi:hypothetical protein|nr:hypothetical protein [Roseinatronobacter sp.]
MARNPTECQHCQQARRLASFLFAGFALALMLSASDPAQDPLRQGALLLCGAMAGVALLRYPIARAMQALGRTIGSKGARP